MAKLKHKSRKLTKQEKIELIGKLKNKLTADELDFITAAVNRRIDEARDAVFVEAIGTSYATFFMVLRDKFGFGVEELRHAWDYTNSYADDITNGRLKLQDLIDTLWEEAGIKIALYEDEEVPDSGREKK